MGQEVNINSIMMKLAKRGFYTLLNVTNAVRHLQWNGENCDFSAKRDGAYYLYTNGQNQGLFLVVPDDAGAINNIDLNGNTVYNLFSTTVNGSTASPSRDSWNTLDFTFLETLTLKQALEYIIYICSNPKIPGWDEFANWANNLMGQFGANLASAIDYIKIGEREENGVLVGGSTIQSSQIQPYPSNGIHSAANFFIWIKDNLEVVDDPTNPSLMSACKDVSNVLSYGIRIHIFPQSGQSWSDIVLTLNLRK